MASVEHLIALVTKMDDQASRKFTDMAGTVEQTAKRIASAQSSVDKALGGTTTAAAKLGEAAKRSEAQVASLGAKSAQALKGGVGVSELVGGAIGGGVGMLINDAVLGIQTMVASVGALADEASRLKTFAKSMSMTTDEAQKFVFIAERFNVPISSMAGGMVVLARQITNNNSAFRDLGINTRNADGSLRSVDSVLVDLAAVFESTGDETAKLALATKLLGEQGRYLLPVLNAGAGALKHVGDQASKTGRMIDDDAVASLTRFDTMLRDISDKWKGLTVRVRVAFVRTLTGGEDTSADGADAVKWMQMQMEAAAKVFPDKFTWDPRTRSATGSMGSLSDAERLRVTAEASRALRAELDAQADAAGKASKAVRDAADNQDKAAQATARFEAQLASLNERLASREMSTAQVDTLAEAFNRGKESVRSLLETLNTADAVTRVVDRARFMTAMVAEYGQAWRGADMLTREHTDHLQKTEDKMRAVRTEMEKLLQATKEETKALEAASEKFRPGVRIPMEPSGPVPETAMGAPQGGRVPAKVWEWLGGQNEDSAAGAMIAAMQKIGGAVDSAVDRWTAKMVVFRGFFGEIMRAIVAEAIRAFARMAAIRIFEKVLEIAGGGGGGGDAISQIKQGVKSGNAIPLTSFGSPAQGRQSGDSASLASSGDGRVPRGTNTTIVNVSALDLGTVVDRIRSPFGALRMALEDAQDAGRA